MKKYFYLIALMAFVNFANAQTETKKANNCFEEWYNAFMERGSVPVQDGEHDVIFSARKDGTCFCGEGKITVKNQQIVPSMMVKKEDGTYEPAKKVLHPNTGKVEGGHDAKYSIFQGMSASFLTDDDYIINLFFSDCLKRKVVPNAVAPSPDAVSGIQITLSEKEKEIIRQAYEGLVFETGKSIIKKESFPHLNLLATMMQEKPEFKLEVNGYTDNIGHAELNQKLSEDRAAAVKDYLVKQGVDANRITAKGFGMENPIGDNTTTEGRAKNRRVEFIMEK